MNKKLLMFGVPILAIALVSAAIYYNIFSATFNVNPAIVVYGAGEFMLPDVTSGEIIFGDLVTITNNAPSERTITITDDSTEDIDVSYISELTLAKKDLTTWIPTTDTQTITYTVVGDTFEVSEVPEGYVAVYYPNTVTYEHYDGVIVLLDDVTVLPVSDDLNGGEESDYCTNTFNPDAVQCVGGKLWIVPVGAVIGNIIDWSQASNFYFETALIQFNPEGNIVMSAGSSLEITPVYIAGDYASGSYTITTTIA